MAAGGHASSPEVTVRIAGSTARWEIRSDFPIDLHWALYVGQSCRIVPALDIGPLFEPVASHSLPVSPQELTEQWLSWWNGLLRERSATPRRPDDPGVPAAAGVLAEFVDENSTEFHHWWSRRGAGMKRELVDRKRALPGFGPAWHLLREFNPAISLTTEILGVEGMFFHAVGADHFVMSQDYEHSAEYRSALPALLGL